jgi:hypothetical protein
MYLLIRRLLPVENGREIETDNRSENKEKVIK